MIHPHRPRSNLQRPRYIKMPFYLLTVVLILVFVLITNLNICPIVHDVVMRDEFRIII